MKKTFLALLLTLALTLTPVLSLAETTEPVELTVWAWDKSFNGFALEEADKLYEGATIHFEEMGKADALQKIHTILASGVTDDLPEIVLISDLQVPGYLMAYPGAFRAMNDVLDYDQFAPYKAAAVSYDGIGYGIPFDSGVAGLFYRTDYMEEIGVTQEDMQNLTWAEYLELGPKLKEKGHLLQTYNPNDIAEFQIMLQSAGSWYTKDDAANFIGNDALKECFSIFKSFHDSDFVKVVSDWTEFTGAINGGEVACVVRGAWISSTIMASEDQAGKWAVAPLPKLSTEGATQYSNQGGSSWFILAGSEHADVAADFFAQTFGKSTDLYNTMLEQKNIIGTFLPASDVPAYSSAHAFYGGQMVNADFSSWLAEIPAINTGAFSIEAQNALLGVTPDILGGADLDACLESAAVQYDQSIQ